MILDMFRRCVAGIILANVVIAGQAMANSEEGKPAARPNIKTVRLYKAGRVRLSRTAPINQKAAMARYSPITALKIWVQLTSPASTP